METFDIWAACERVPNGWLNGCSVSGQIQTQPCKVNKYTLWVQIKTLTNTLYIKWQFSIIHNISVLYSSIASIGSFCLIEQADLFHTNTIIVVKKKQCFFANVLASPKKSSHLTTSKKAEDEQKKKEQTHTSYNRRYVANRSRRLFFFASDNLYRNNRYD